MPLSVFTQSVNKTQTLLFLHSLRKHPFLLALFFAAGEVSRGETDVYFSRVFRTSEDSPLAGVFKGARILFLTTAVFYVKVRLIYKLCCYFMNFCKSKSSNLLVSMYQNTAAGRDEIRAP